MRLVESEIVARSIFLLAVAIVVSALFVVQVTGGHNMAATNSGLARIDFQSTLTSGNITLSVPTQQTVLGDRPVRTEVVHRRLLPDRLEPVSSNNGVAQPGKLQCRHAVPELIG